MTIRSKELATMSPPHRGKTRFASGPIPSRLSGASAGHRPRLVGCGPRPRTSRAARAPASRQSIEEQDPIEMVDLVLQDPGEEARRAHQGAAAGRRARFDHHAEGAPDLIDGTRDTETTLRPDLRPPPAPQARIDQRDGSGLRIG